MLTSTRFRLGQVLTGPVVLEALAPEGLFVPMISALSAT